MMIEQIAEWFRRSERLSVYLQNKGYITIDSILYMAIEKMRDSIYIKLPKTLCKMTLWGGTKSPALIQAALACSILQRSSIKLIPKYVATSYQGELNDNLPSFVSFLSLGCS